MSISTKFTVHAPYRFGAEEAPTRRPSSLNQSNVILTQSFGAFSDILSVAMQALLARADEVIE
jgi:hypothetical protein